MNRDIILDAKFSKIILALLNELPPDKVLIRYVSKSITVGQMKLHVINRTPEAKEFVSNLLRVSRDLIQRQAERQ